MSNSGPRASHKRGGRGKGKGDRSKGRGAGKAARSGPQYDPSTPCGYFMAGFCRYGDACQKQHSVEYAMTVREEWLHAGCSERQEKLELAAEAALGQEQVQVSKLFPRVFSEELRGLPLPEGVTDTRYLLVLDLEGKDEITEFPVIAYDLAKGREAGRFQRYVRPEHLFDGCAINEESPAIPFGQVLVEFDCWLRETLGIELDAVGDGTDPVAVFMTCGDWDCKHVRTQCSISGIQTPAAFSQWVNIKRAWNGNLGQRVTGMRGMLGQLQLLDRDGNVVHGFHHLGMHDVENILRCALHLIKLEMDCWTPTGWQNLSR